LEPVELGKAASPSNDSERLLLRNLFDNLVRLDCEGTVRPALAESWTVDSGGRGWIVTLRKGATFPAGDPMSASDVVGTLRLLDIIDTASARAFGMDSAIALDDRHLRLVMNDTVGDYPPRFLADPALVLIDGLAFGGGAGEGSLEVTQRGGLPVIDFRFPLKRDPRDALDQEVDLMVTRDPALVDYVSNRAEFATFPLPWSRTYVLAEPGAGQGELAGGLSAASVRNSLAKDAVRADGRVADPPYWWSDNGKCRPTSPLPTKKASSRIVYRKDDEVARSLAERIVALASAGAGLRAMGLDAAEFTTAVNAGLERAYIIGLPRQSLAPCRDASMWPAGVRLLPLIETRAYAIVRKGTPPLTVEWDGTLRVVQR
jgi:hypothetical protein